MIIPAAETASSKAKDSTAAERQRRYRERQRESTPELFGRDGVTRDVTERDTVTERDVEAAA